MDLLWPQPPLTCSSHHDSTPGPLSLVVAACVKDARPSRWLSTLERPRWPQQKDHRREVGERRLLPPVAQQGLLNALLVEVDTCALLRERGQPVRSFKRPTHRLHRLELEGPKIEKRPAATSQLGSNGFAGYIESGRKAACGCIAEPTLLRGAGS